MSALRFALLTTTTLALAAAGVAALPHPRRPAAGAGAAPALPVLPAFPPTAIQAAGAPPSFRPGPPAPDLRDVPPGILARAADARALDRREPPACSAAPAARPEAACAPARDAVEIQWDVVRDP